MGAPSKQGKQIKDHSKGLLVNISTTFKRKNREDDFFLSSHKLPSTFVLPLNSNDRYSRHDKLGAIYIKITWIQLGEYLKGDSGRRVFLRDNTFTAYVHFMTAEEKIQLEWVVTPLKAVGGDRNQG
ncbi:UNVERIFIED_CONTAM: hypothetical protein K2H54_074616 [Gekko kuhli]